MPTTPLTDVDAPAKQAAHCHGLSPALEDMTTGACAAGAIIAVADAGMHIQAVNVACAALIGCEPAELPGRALQVGPAAGAVAAHSGRSCDRRRAGEGAPRRQGDAAVDVDGHGVQVSASIGVALPPSDGGDLSRAADAAMYRAKKSGRGCVARAGGGPARLALDAAAQAEGV